MNIFNEGDELQIVLFDLENQLYCKGTSRIFLVREDSLIIAFPKPFDEKIHIDFEDVSGMEIVFESVQKIAHGFRANIMEHVEYVGQRGLIIHRPHRTDMTSFNRRNGQRVRPANTNTVLKTCDDSLLEVVDIIDVGTQGGLNVRVSQTFLSVLPKSIEFLMVDIRFVTNMNEPLFVPCSIHSIKDVQKPFISIVLILELTQEQKSLLSTFVLEQISKELIALV